MKVYMGGYPDTWWRCSLHSDYMDKKYNYDWKDNNTKFEKVLEKIEDAIQFVYNNTINQIVKHRTRKIKIRIDREDTWAMDNTLAFIIVPMLKQLKATKHGAPFVDDVDVPEHLRSTAAEPKENEWDTDSNHFKRWDWVMDEMIHAFETELDDGWDSQFHSGVIDFQFKKNEDGYSEMYHGPNHTHVYDKDSAKKAWDRRDNGRRLFAKYYHNLWD